MCVWVSVCASVRVWGRMTPSCFKFKLLADIDLMSMISSLLVHTQMQKTKKKKKQNQFLRLHCGSSHVYFNGSFVAFVSHHASAWLLSSSCVILLICILLLRFMGSTGFCDCKQQATAFQKTRNSPFSCRFDSLIGNCR